MGGQTMAYAVVESVIIATEKAAKMNGVVVLL